MAHLTNQLEETLGTAPDNWSTLEFDVRLREPKPHLRDEAPAALAHFTAMAGAYRAIPGFVRFRVAAAAGAGLPTIAVAVNALQSLERSGQADELVLRGLTTSAAAPSAA